MLEHIPCGTLRSLIQKRAPFDPVTTAFYFSNIVCALAFLQKYDVIHRDLKPENVLVGADGYLCLADFGSAANEFDEDDWIMIGTPTYMAPEIFSGAEQSRRTYGAVDWWSAGCILFEMATRKMVRVVHISLGVTDNADRSICHGAAILRTYTRCYLPESTIRELTMALYGPDGKEPEIAHHWAFDC